MSETIEKGDDFKKTKDSNYVTYGINIGDHGNKVEVHGDPALRDDLIVLMNSLSKGFKWIDREAIISGEDFSYRARVLCSFPKTSGKVRYVVEDNSRLFIQRDAQITYVDQSPAQLKKMISDGSVQVKAKLVEAPQPAPICDVLEMKHSSGFSDFYTMVRVGERSLTIYMSKTKGECEYHAAEFNWLLNGGNKPGILDFDYTEPEGLAEYQASIQPQPAPSVHPDDLAVDRFAAAMKAKLAKKREEGRGGWDQPGTGIGQRTLSHMLREHVEKGDPLDVGNLAMMLHQRGEQICQPAPSSRAIVEQCWGALNFILAFYEPGQTYLDTNAWKEAEASGRRAHKAAREYLDASTLSPPSPAHGAVEALREAEAATYWKGAYDRMAARNVSLCRAADEVLRHRPDYAGSAWDDLEELVAVGGKAALAQPASQEPEQTIGEALELKYERERKLSEDPLGR